ncbi:MAG TPA: thioredoxin family protein [Acidisarcina sp.]
MRTPCCSLLPKVILTASLACCLSSSGTASAQTPGPAAGQKTPPSQPSDAAAAGSGATVDPDAISAMAHSILESGLRVTGLTSSDGKPWHMKADYQLFNEGKPPDTGTVEEWWAGPDNWRRTYVTKDTTWTEWSQGRAHQFQSSKGFYYEYLDLRVAWPLIMPMYQTRNFKPEYPMDFKQVSAGVTLNCVSVIKPLRYADGLNPDFLFPKLCYDAGHRLRFMGTSDTTVTFNKYQMFQDRAVAYKMEVIVLGEKRSSADITLLEPLGPDGEALLKPDEKAIPQPFAIQVWDPQPVPVYQVAAVYPMAALQNHQLGTVMVPALIDKDGRVKVTGFPPNLLAQAAADAIKRWRYEPYKVDGETVEAATRISYTFDGYPFVPQTGVKVAAAGGYDPRRDPENDLKDAIASATQAHKRILLEVGGDWCIWCKYMDKFFDAHHDLQAMRDSNFVTVKVNMSSENSNVDFLHKFPKIAGYPHIFVLDADGKFLQSQDTNLLESGNGYSAGKVRDFLTQWKPS